MAEISSDRLKRTLGGMFREREFVLFDETLQVSLPVCTMIDYFRELLAIGGLVSSPVVILCEGSAGNCHGTFVTDVVEYGRGLFCRLLVIDSDATEQVIKNWCETCDMDEGESAIRLACHEARHVLQRSRLVTFRGAQWFDGWCKKNLRGNFLHMGDLVYDMDALREHALSGSWSRNERSVRKLMCREHDAESVALACTILWRNTRSLYQVARLLHE